MTMHPVDGDRAANTAPEPEAGPGTSARRLAALATLLDRAGVAYSGVRAAGQGGEIAVVEAPPTEFTALAAIAREVRVLGFRFVTLDLGPPARGDRGGASAGRSA